MNHIEILKRAWHILWSYKALWVFGFILAVTTASGSRLNAANSTSSGGPSNNQPPPEFMGESFYENWEEVEEGFDLLFNEGIRTEIVNTIFAVAIGIGCLTFVIIIIAVIFRYMSETALIRMVNHYEETGEKLSIRQGFRLGFSRTAIRVFLVDLVINLPLFLLMIFLLIIFLAPLFLLLTASEAAGILGVVLTIGLFFVSIFVAIVIGVAISLLKHFFRRAVAIEGLSIFEAIGFGFNLVRDNLVAVILMGLIILGINIGFSILLIPVGLLVLIASAVVSGAIGLAVGGLMSLVSAGALPIVVGLVVGLPIFITLMVIPLGFIDGLREVYMSSTWTLTYREARTLERLGLEKLSTEFEADGNLPELDTPHQTS
jgi:hypothetical protein